VGLATVPLGYLELKNGSTNLQLEFAVQYSDVI